MESKVKYQWCISVLRHKPKSFVSNFFLKDYQLRAAKKIVQQLILVHGKDNVILEQVPQTSYIPWNQLGR